MHDIAVYTAITGGYDSLKHVPGNWANEAAFIAYIDRPQFASAWESRPACGRFSDPVRNAKVHKIIPHDLFATHRYSVWLDGAVQIKSRVPVTELVSCLLGTCDLAVFRHRTRTCIYQEAEACIRAQRDSTDTIRRQMATYRERGYPPGNGLNECTVLVRRHTAELARFCEAWHDEIVAHSRRDQLSFNYVARMLGFEYAEIPGTIMNNEHFLWLYHDHGTGDLRIVV